VQDVGHDLDVDALPIAARRWLKVTDVVAVVADPKNSTKLGTGKWAQSTASIYEAATGNVEDLGAGEGVPPRVSWRLSIHVRMRVMAAPKKDPDELRERATRLAVDPRRDPATRTGALKRIGDQLGIDPETLRNWVIRAEIDEGHRPGTTTDDATRLAELEREVRELRRANAILKSASAFFAAEFYRPSR
jgi:transposase-like protein